MCGLVAVINRLRNGFNHNQLEVFRTLLLVDTLRGEDSTGIFGVDNLGNVGIVKDAINGASFLQTKEYKEMETAAYRSGWAMVGHNRKATRGAITDKNAHPFWVEDKLVLVHNGTMFGDHKKLKDVEVDSEAIAHAIAEHPDDFKEAFKKFNAAYALMWYDVDKKILRITRNEHRPLCWVATSTMYILCSEPAFLEMVVKRLDLKTEKNVSNFPANEVTEFHLNNDKGMTIHSFPLKDEPIVQNPVLPLPPVTTGGPLAHVKDVVRNFMGKNNDNVVDIKPRPTTKEHKDAIKVFVETMGAEINHTSYGDWQKLKPDYENEDGTSKRIIVHTNDLIQYGDDYLLIGQTKDEHKAYAMFPVTQTKFDEIMKLQSKEEAVFEVTVEKVVWLKTAQEHDLKDMSKWEGVCAVYCTNPHHITNHCAC
jgi:predicted glutamine amidotransferase